MHTNLFHQMISMNFDEHSEHGIFAMRRSRLISLFLCVSLCFSVSLSLALSIIALFRLLLFPFWINSLHRTSIIYFWFLPFFILACGTRTRCKHKRKLHWTKESLPPSQKARTSCYSILFNSSNKGTLHDNDLFTCFHFQ